MSTLESQDLKRKKINIQGKASTLKMKAKKLHSISSYSRTWAPTKLKYALWLNDRQPDIFLKF